VNGSLLQSGIAENQSPKKRGFTLKAIGQISPWGESRLRPWINARAGEATAWAERNKAVFAILMLLQIAAYSYFYTSIILTNHTLPEVWLYPFPSSMTRALGRWMEDLTLQAQGGSGVQPFAMLCATALQAINGILLAELIGLGRKRDVLSVAALLCLYPAFLDYYSFVADQLSFVVGDHFAILGVLVFVGSRRSWLRVMGAAFFFLLAIACHQPRIALVSFLAAGAVLLTLGSESKKTDASLASDRQAIRDGLALLVAIAIAVVAYWISSKILVERSKFAHDWGVSRVTHLSTLPEALGQVAISYRRVLAFFIRDLPGLPWWLRFLPAIGVAVGALDLLWRAWQRGWRTALIAVGVLALIPIALRATYVINCKSPETFGRILFVNGYCLAFFIGCGLRTERLRALSAAVAIPLLYFFFILATQESNAAAYKTTYEMSMIQRIAARAETLLESNVLPKAIALVVVGNYPQFKREPYVRHPGRVSLAGVHQESFTFYRHVDYLNFFCGNKYFRQPSQDERSRAIESTRDKAPWPSSESVYRLEDTIVVFLERHGPGIPVTSAGPAKVPKSPPPPADPPPSP